MRFWLLTCASTAQMQGALRNLGQGGLLEPEPFSPLSLNSSNMALGVL